MPARAAGKPKGGVAQLAALLDQGGMQGRGRRSSLSRWLRAHHDAFAAMLADKEPSWDEVATALAAMGLRDGEGKPPTGERTRKAWWAMRRAKAAARAKRQGTPLPALALGELAPGVHAAPGTDVAGVSRPRPRLDIRPATPLAHTPARPLLPIASPIPLPSGPIVTGSAVLPVQPQPDEGAAEQVRRLREQMETGKVPVPKVVL